MSRSTPSERILFLVSGYVLGTLEEAESEEFARSIIEDPTILEAVDQMQEALEQTYSPMAVEPPPQLREKVLIAQFANASVAVRPPQNMVQSMAQNTAQNTASAAFATTPSSLPPALSSQSARSASRWLWVAASAIIVALGFSNYGLWRSLKQQLASTPAQPTAEPLAAGQPAIAPLTYRLTSTNAAAGTAKVAVNTDRLTAQLDAAQLPELPPDQVYVLWAVLKPEAPFTTDSKGAVLTTTFRVGPEGSTNKTLAVPEVFQQPELVAALGITIESADAPQGHTGSPVLLSEPL
ncbi:MAG: anti-sigma factor [Phormidesmis sp.]